MFKPKDVKRANFTIQKKSKTDLPIRKWSHVIRYFIEENAFHFMTKFENSHENFFIVNTNKPLQI